MADDISTAQRILGITANPPPDLGMVPNFQTMDTGPQIEHQPTPEEVQSAFMAQPPTGIGGNSATVDVPTEVPGTAVVPPTEPPPESGLGAPLVAQPDLGAMVPNVRAMGTGASLQAPPEQAGPSPAAEPTPEQQQQADAAIKAPVQQQIAVQRAHQGAQRDIAAEMLKQADDLQKIRDDAAADAQRVENDVRVKTLPQIMQQGSFGEKLGASIALLVGGISQGLTHAKTNPVEDFIDSAVARQDAKDKLTAEQKLAAKKLMLDSAIAKMTALEHASQDQNRRGLLQVSIGHLQLARDEATANILAKVQANQMKMGSQDIQARALNGQSVSASEATFLPEHMQKNLVHLPDGRVGVPLNEEDRKAVTTAQNEIEPAAQGLDRILQMSKEINRFNIASPERAALQTAMTKEALQVGPILTNSKRFSEAQLKVVREAMGDPTKLFALPAIQRARLEEMRDGLRQEADQAYSKVGYQSPQAKLAGKVSETRDSLRKKGYNDQDIDKVLGKGR